jgi:hypothetical protein
MARGPGEYHGKHLSYIPDHKSFGEFMLSDQSRDFTEQVAGDISDLAGHLAPKDSRSAVHMADQFRVVREGGTMVVDGNPRVEVHVINSDKAAAPNEFGGANNKRHRMLARAGAAFGDFKHKKGLR